MLKIEPGREDDFERVRAWLTASASLDRIVALTEPDVDPLPRPLPRALFARRGFARGQQRALLYPVPADPRG